MNGARMSVSVGRQTDGIGGRDEPELRRAAPRRATGRGSSRTGPARGRPRARRPCAPRTHCAPDPRPIRRPPPPSRTRSCGRAGRPARPACGRAPTGRAGASPARRPVGSTCRGSVGISSNRNVLPSAKCVPRRLVANIGCTDRPSAAHASANSRLRAHPSGAWGICVTVLRCTGLARRARHGEDEPAVVVGVAGEEACAG